MDKGWFFVKIVFLEPFIIHKCLFGKLLAPIKNIPIRMKWSGKQQRSWYLLLGKKIIGYVKEVMLEVKQEA